MTPWTVASRLLCPRGFSRQEHWSGFPCPPPGNLPNPGIKPRSPILQLDSLLSEPPGKPKTTGVVTYPFCRGTSWSRNRTQVSCIAGEFYTSWATREAYTHTHTLIWRLPGCLSSKESTCQCRSCRRCGFDFWIGKICWSRKWQPTSVFLLGKFNGQMSLAGYSPWGCKV